MECGTEQSACRTCRERLAVGMVDKVAFPVSHVRKSRKSSEQLVSLILTIRDADCPCGLNDCAQSYAALQRPSVGSVREAGKGQLAAAVSAADQSMFRGLGAYACS